MCSNLNEEEEEKKSTSVTQNSRPDDQFYFLHSNKSNKNDILPSNHFLEFKLKNILHKIISIKLPHLLVSNTNHIDFYKVQLLLQKSWPKIDVCKMSCENYQNLRFHPKFDKLLRILNFHHFQHDSIPKDI